MLIQTHRIGKGKEAGVVFGNEAVVDAQRVDLIESTHDLFENLGQRALHLFASRAEREGMTFLGFKALHVIHRHGPEIKLGQVAESIHVPPSSMTGIADRLVRAGYIERVPSASDRRAVVVTITEQGEEAINVANAGVREDLTAVMTDFSDTDIRSFNGLLSDFLAGIEKELARRPGGHE
jgi:DNA-binding MarR family transcriptional regulator